MEIAKALRMQAALLVHLWRHCVLALTQIINRLPTPILKHLTPYEVLLDRKLDYTSRKFIGCLAFTANPDRSHDKMAPKEVPCVFLGYPQT